MEVEVEVEGYGKEEQKMEEQELESRNLRMFPCGRNYVLSSFGVLRLFTILICLAAFIVNEMTYCNTVTCYFSTYRYFSAVSFLIFTTSIALYVLYLSGVVQNLRFHPRVKAIVEITYFGICLFFYFFASAFILPRTNGIAGFQISSALSIFALILITVHLALMLYHTNKQSEITYESRDNSSSGENTEESWIGATESNRESVPKLHSIRLRCSSVESLHSPTTMEEVDLTDSPVFIDKSRDNSFSSLSSSSSSSSSSATVEGSWKVVET